MAARRTSKTVIMASITHLNGAGVGGTQQSSHDHALAGGEGGGLEARLGLLKAAGFRLTPQRRAIVEMFHADAGHLTPQQVFVALCEVVPSMSLATVYNTLEVLEEVGLLTRVTGHDGQTYFDPTVVPHHHALCDGCGEIFDIFLKPGALKNLVADSQALQAHNAEFCVTDATVWLRGRCKSCQS